ncbi:MAG: response regulator transcription factor [Deltaproteobacteria bacterium]|nr:response regulator transcription factor [Deltaproteobacteria bacterium]
MEKILVIEDNKDYQFLIQTSLGKEYRVIVADNGNSGVELAKAQRPDLILLDISLGEVDGFEVCHRLRAQKETEKVPIIFLSSRSDTSAKKMGFDLGADDYVQKPFEAEELIARIKARIKQSKVNRENLPAFEHEGLKVDFVGHRVFLIDKEVSFSALEFKLLAYFIRHPDHVLARDKILNSVWGETFVSDRVVDSHIRTIRKKLGPFKGHIESIYGEGYRFNPSPLSQDNAIDDDLDLLDDEEDSTKTAA